MNKVSLALSVLLVVVLSGCEKQSETQQNLPAKPVKEVVWEEKTEIPTWSATLVKRFRGPEGSDNITLDVELVDRGGNKRILARNILGPIVVFEKDRIIASCEEAGSINMGPFPIFISLNGETNNGPTHKGFVGKCARVEGAELLIVKYNKLRSSNGKPYSLVRLIDTTGVLVLEREFDDADILEFRYNNQTYKFDLPAPELPG